MKVCRAVGGRPSTRKGPSVVGKSRKASWKGQLNQSRKIQSLVTPDVPSVSQGSEGTHLRNTEAEDPKKESRWIRW